jgi:hypothetical protein
MEPGAERDVHCPRCGYNLRGLTEPRCPECGFEFDFAQLRTGLLRENVPTWLDRCDPWQPHQVLLRSLYELVQGALRPRRLLTTLDVNGPLTPAGLMLVFGVLWLWLLTAAIMAAAIMLHTGASPATAVKAAGLAFAPRTFLPAVVTGFAAAVLAGLPRAMRVARPTPRQQFRLVAYAVPTIAAYGCIPAAVGWCAIPDFVLGTWHIWTVLPALVGGLAARPWLAAVEDAGRMQVALRVGWGVASIGLALLLAYWLWPDSLEPPWWVYFL